MDKETLIKRLEEAIDYFREVTDSDEFSYEYRETLDDVLQYLQEEGE